MSAPINSIELNELRFTTACYIWQNPTMIALTPSGSIDGAKVQQPSGGYDYTPTTPRPTQAFRLLARDANARGGSVRSHNDDGKTLQYKYTLIGFWDAVVEYKDSWDDTAPDGTPIHYHVDAVMPYNGYEVVALVTSFARLPQHGDG